MFYRFFFILTFLCATAGELLHLTVKNERQTVAYAQEQVNKLENSISRSLDTISAFQSAEQFHEFFIHHDQQKHGFSFFYFDLKDTLTDRDRPQYWSDNETPLLSDVNIDSIKNGSLIRLPNGIYEAFVKESNYKKIVGLLLLKKDYAYENKFLVNSFNPKLGLPENTVITNGDSLTDFGSIRTKYDLYSEAGKKLLSISFSGERPNDQPFTLQAWLYMLAFVFFLFAVFLFTRYRRIHFTTAIGIAFSLIVLRLTMIWLQLPAGLYHTDFFSPKFYASSFFFNSIGDLLLNGLTIFCCAAIFFAGAKSFERKEKPNNILLMLSAFLVVVLLLVFLHKLFEGIVINSKISFDISNILNLNINSLAGVLVFMLFLWALLNVLKGIYHLMFSDCNRKDIQPKNYIILLLFSLYTTFIIIHYSNNKEYENQKLFAQRLDTRQDHLAEYLFEDVEKRISRDSVLIHLLKQFTAYDLVNRRDSLPNIRPKMVNRKLNEVVNKRLQQFYFNGYWNKFDISDWCFDINDSAVETSSLRLKDFKLQIEEQGRETYCDKLFFLQNESGRLSYLAILPLINIHDSTAKSGTIVLRLEARIFQQTEGFPELFVSRRVHENNGSEANYSFGRYYNGTLVSTFGNYPYPFTPQNFSNVVADFTTFHLDHYIHLAFKPSPTSIIVISRPEEDFFKSLSLFSYILIFYSLFFWGAYSLSFVSNNIYGKKGKANTRQLTLKQRVRLFFVALVILSFVLIATGTVVYFVRKYDKDQDQNILLRLNALWNVLYDNFTPMQTGADLSSVNYDTWSAQLNQLADNLNVDFNLYDETGNLFYSSQGKIFEEGIISMRIHPEALFEMNKYNRTQYVHPENIGRLNYISAYAPFTNQKGSITGYVNLPYFEKQNELKKEISGFLSALINIYVLLLVIAIFLALFISSRITQPLILIQQKLKDIRRKSSEIKVWESNTEALGAQRRTLNTKLEWNRNDEIGELVREYNHMVSELEVSAEKLARSERESAWREMAQQVAHEIKNPLTPMKLSVQHLQKAWLERTSQNENRKNFDELFQRISQTLIEQINTLSNIATEFSNFAKMPKAKKELVDLNSIIQSSINLFENTPNVQIEYRSDNPIRNVFADKEQLMRVFSNLIKNAVQSVEQNSEGLIKVNFKSNFESHLIEISDNGVGIPLNVQSKIFTPYFTTKTSGMGLGLAMVKSIIEEMGGSIHFKSKEGQGTTFFITLPVAS